MRGELPVTEFMGRGRPILCTTQPSSRKEKIDAVLCRFCGDVNLLVESGGKNQMAVANELAVVQMSSA